MYSTVRGVKLSQKKKAGAGRSAALYHFLRELLVSYPINILYNLQGTFGGEKKKQRVFLFCFVERYLVKAKNVMQESKKMNISYSNSNDTVDSDKDDKDEIDAGPCYILVPCLSGSILYNQVSWNRPSADLSLSTNVLLHM